MAAGAAVISVVGAALPAVSTAAAGDPPPVHRGARVASYNVKSDAKFTKARVTALKKTITDSGAGLVGLQELGTVARRAGVAKIAGFSVTTPTYKGKPINTPLLRRTADFKVRASKGLRVAESSWKAPRNKSCRQADPSNATTQKGWLGLYHVQAKKAPFHQYIVANVHLTPRAACMARRQEEVNAMKKHIKAFATSRPKAGLIVMGDFNSDVNKSEPAGADKVVETLQSVGARKLTNVLKTHKTSNAGWDDRTDNDTNTVDYVLVQEPHFNASTSAVVTTSHQDGKVRRSPSDHYLLWSNVWVPNAQR